MKKRIVPRCRDCAFRGDKFSFPLPNGKPMTDPDKPDRKAIFCVNGDCGRYGERVDPDAANTCEYFEEA